MSTPTVTKLQGLYTPVTVTITNSCGTSNCIPQPASGNVQVQFTVSPLPVSPCEYRVNIYTRQFGDLAPICPVTVIPATPPPPPPPPPSTSLPISPAPTAITIPNPNLPVGSCKTYLITVVIACGTDEGIVAALPFQVCNGCT